MMDIPQATFSEKKSATELCFVPNKYLPRRGAAITAGLSSLCPTCFQNTGKRMSWISHRLNVVTLFYFAIKYLLTLKVRH